MNGNLLNCEWTSLSQLIYRINRCRTYEEFAQTVMMQVQTIIPFTKGMVFQTTRENGQITLSHPCDLTPGDIPFDEDKYIKGNYYPKWANYLCCPWSSVFRYSDITLEEDWTGSPIYKDILEPQKLHYAVYLTLIHQDQALGVIAFWRRIDEKDFSERELSIFEMLKIHLELKFYQTLAFDMIPKENSPAAIRTSLSEFSEKYGLTRKELEVVQFLSSGRSCTEICEALYISDSTLRKHIYNIYQKADIKNRTQLIQKIKPADK